MWNRGLIWLRSAPISDPVDRRNAPVMQLLLLCYGVLLPLNWAWRIFARGALPDDGRMVILLMDVAVVALAWAGIALIRRGRLRPAVMLFLAPQLISLAVMFFLFGPQLDVIDPAPIILPLVIAALVLGRAALWATFGLLMLTFAIGFGTEVAEAGNTPQALRAALLNAPSVLISHLLITAVLDRTVTALRESLAESESRGRDLQREMAERERAQAQLIHAQKLEATGRLASGIAHDFGNILDVILGFARQRHDAGDLPDARQSRDALSESLEGVETAARRGTVMTRKLLGFSRADLLKPQTFDLRDVATDLQPMLRQLFPPSVRLALEAGDTPSPVHIDRSELEMMLLNVAANARDAMPHGGRFEVRVFDADGMAGIRLADSGHGMDTQVQRRIFEPFFSTKDASVGTGLGLSVIQDLVRAAGGDIRVDSAPGHGTTFVIRLPRAGNAIQAPALNT
jgi:signal transduction histidine kinase